ncbi:MAG TPA: CHAT domain-containing protein [Thermoanaerobaculia bacterium]
MSTIRKSAAEREVSRRRWIFAAGAVLGWALAQLAGALLSGELQALRILFIPFSALAGGLAALGAATYFGGLADTAKDAVRKRRVRAVLAGLAVGAVLLLGLYLRFAVPIHHAGRTGNVTYLVGWSRSESCVCSPDDATCIQQMSLDPARFRSCWNGLWAVELALALSYLLTLGSIGMLAGVLMIRVKPQALGAPQGYLDFDVWIDQKPNGLYRAKAWSGVAGFEATEHFALSADSGRLSHAGGGALRGGPGAAEVADGASPEQVGGELFRTVFQGELLKAYQGCLAKARGGPGLRIRLRLNDVPQLAELPWEYLYDAAGQGFLALSARTPVVRYLELSEGLGTLLVEPPLRVLAVISTPKGYRDLAEADEEWRRLGAALEPLRQSGLIEVERLARPTPEALEKRLRTGEPVHVLHFVGHGGFSELRGEGVLVFEDDNGNGVPVGGPSLAYLFQDHPSLRLAVLNACNGARSSQEDTFAGTAQVLVQHGVPAVIAMQAEVMDETACSFAEKFYRGLASGLPVDACVGEVRRALAAERNPEWGTPVLYLRATDGRLFALEGGDPQG